MPVPASEVVTKGIVVALDNKYPDMVYIEIKFENEIAIEEWPAIHRQLQKRYKANFPYEERKRQWEFPNTFGFLGVRQVSEKLARCFSNMEDEE